MSRSNEVDLASIFSDSRVVDTAALNSAVIGLKEALDGFDSWLQTGSTVKENLTDALAEIAALTGGSDPEAGDGDDDARAAFVRRVLRDTGLRKRNLRVPKSTSDRAWANFGKALGIAARSGRSPGRRKKPCCR